MVLAVAVVVVVAANLWFCCCGCLLLGDATDPGSDPPKHVGLSFSWISPPPPRACRLSRLCLPPNASPRGPGLYVLCVRVLRLVFVGFQQGGRDLQLVYRLAVALEGCQSRAGVRCSSRPQGTHVWTPNTHAKLRGARAGVSSPLGYVHVQNTKFETPESFRHTVVVILKP